MSKTTSRLCLGIVLGLLLSLVVCLPDLTASEKSPAKKQGGGDLIVEVNGVKLTQDQLTADINGRLDPLKDRMPADRLEQLKGQMHDKMVDDFITRTLIRQEAEKQKMSVTDEETDQAIKDFEKSLPEGMTIDSALQMSGMTKDKMRQDISFSLLAKKLIDSQVKPGPAPTDEDVKNYYATNKQKYESAESVHARHILIKTDEKDSAEVKAEKKKKIEALQKKLSKGEDFSQLAKDNSDCPSKAKGGDLGTFTRGRMVKPFEDAAFGQKVNEIGPVIETQFGYHIIQVLEHNQASTKQLEEVKDQIKEKIVQKSKNDATQQYIEGLKAKAKIVYASKDKK